MKVMRYLEQKGQGIVEYALILAFVVGIAAVALNSNSGLGQAIQNVFTRVTNQLGGTNANGNG
ncbi:MAG: pilin [Anaerovibrio sp.]|nr:pilin [Anaerovibrio sp.]